MYSVKTCVSPQASSWSPKSMHVCRYVSSSSEPVGAAADKAAEAQIGRDHPVDAEDTAVSVVRNTTPSAS
jgi:hypothetical protein